MEISTAYPRGLNDLMPFRNYYTLEKVEKFNHRFEVLYSTIFCEQEVNYVIMLRGNTPETIGGDFFDGPMPAVKGSENGMWEGSPKLVDCEPENFRTVAPISKELKPIVDAIVSFIQRKNGKLLKIRYDGFKRQITFNEIISLGPDEDGRSSSYKFCTLKAYHAQNTEILECGQREMAVGSPPSLTPAFIPFYPSEIVEGRLLLDNFDRISSFQNDWHRFSKIALGMIDRNERLPYPQFPPKFKFFVYYEVDCVGRTPLANKKEGLPFKFIQDDAASRRITFAFDILKTLQSAVEETQEVPELNLRISVVMDLRLMEVNLKIKGLQTEHEEKIRFRGTISYYKGWPILKSQLVVKTPFNLSFPGKKRASPEYPIQIIDGQKYSYIDVTPEQCITPVGS